MNRMQRLALLVGVIVVVGMGVYSPWMHIKRGARGIYTTESAGYSLIVSPPPCKTGAAYSVELDVSRLAVQEGIVVIATMMIVLLFKGQRPGEQQ